MPLAPNPVQVDVWSLGCTLAELLYGAPLFEGATIEAVLAAQHAVLGNHPRSMLLGDPETARMYFTPTGRLYSVDPMGQPRGVYSLRSTSPKPLGELLGVSDPEFISFLTGLLRLDPAERLSVAEALAHPWVADEVATFREAQREPRHESRPGEALSTSDQLLYPRSGCCSVTCSTSASGGTSPTCGRTTTGTSTPVNDSFSSTCSAAITVLATSGACSASEPAAEQSRPAALASTDRQSVLTLL